jgi:uroporphyrin-III C-methyltransferase/precorrin-2 dehydrogenase/sirohydrochlorin ferrochelatase
MRAFPIFVQAEGRTIVVFGGGADAAAKLRLVAKTAGAHPWSWLPDLVPGEIDLGDVPNGLQTHPLTARLPRRYTAFAYAATGDEALDAKIAAHARANHVLVCAADQPEVSDFITPAIVDRDPVVIAIGTEGTAPVLARMIKAQIEAALPQALGGTRRARQRLPRPRRRRPSRRAGGAPPYVLAQPSSKDALAGPPGCRNRAVSAPKPCWLARPGIETRDGFVSFVGAGPGGPDLMTLKARKVLDEADVVLYDALVAPEILELARREALMVNVGKRCGSHAHETARNLRSLGSACQARPPCGAPQGR